MQFESTCGPYAEDAKMQVNIHSVMIIIVNNHLDWHLVDIRLGNTLQISCKLLNALERFQKLTTPQNRQSLANFRIVYLTRFLSDFTCLGINAYFNFIDALLNLKESLKFN